MVPVTIVSSTVGIIVLYKKNVSGLLNIANSQILPTIFSELKKYILKVHRRTLCTVVLWGEFVMKNIFW